MQRMVADSAHAGKGAGVVARANKGGRVGTPTTQGVVAGSTRATKGVGAGSRATTRGRAGAPACKDKKSDKVTSASKAEAPSRDADSAAEDKVPRVFDIFTGEPKVGEADDNDLAGLVDALSAPMPTTTTLQVSWRR
ncbi:hypothetical protein PF003_g6099 [Phytophthora fragariae]|nr:hypothetical protein PF003_g6099 [Phytophthora fragariae]